MFCNLEPKLFSVVNCAANVVASQHFFITCLQQHVYPQTKTSTKPSWIFSVGQSRSFQTFLKTFSSNSWEIMITLFSTVMLCFTVKVETVCPSNAGWLFSAAQCLSCVIFSSEALSVGCAHYLSWTRIQWWDVMHTVLSESSASLNRRTCSRCCSDWLDFITSVWTASSTWLYRHVTNSRESLQETEKTQRSVVCSQCTVNLTCFVVFNSFIVNIKYYRLVKIHQFSTYWSCFSSLCFILLLVSPVELTVCIKALAVGRIGLTETQQLSKHHERSWALSWSNVTKLSLLRFKHTEGNTWSLQTEQNETLPSSSWRE